jgi:WD40 repeat protein
LPLHLPAQPDRLSGRRALHRGWVGAAVFDPSGSRLASGGGDRVAKLWDAGTGKLLRTFAGHRGPITGLVFSDAGRRLLSASGDGSVRAGGG